MPWGVQDPCELGTPNVMVELQDFNGNIIATTFTDSSGNYLFTGVAVGTYTVRLDENTLQPGGIFTTPSPQAVGLAAGEVFLDADLMVVCAVVNPTSLESANN